MNLLKRAISVTGLVGNQTLKSIQQNVRTVSSTSKFASQMMDRKFEPLNEIKPLNSKMLTAYLNGLKPELLPGEAKLQQMHDVPFVRIKKKPQAVFGEIGKPLCKGIVLRTLVKKPRKPNSANRKCVQLRMSTGKEMIAYVPGEGHNLQEHNAVLCKIARLRDTPGVKIKCIRGTYDLPHVVKKRD